MSVAEARRSGCLFDIMMNGWVPKECYNKQLWEEFMSPKRCCSMYVSAERTSNPNIREILNLLLIRKTKI